LFALWSFCLRVTLVGHRTFLLYLCARSDTKLAGVRGQTQSLQECAEISYFDNSGYEIERSYFFCHLYNWSV
jgi:hypothetical protein